MHNLVNYAKENVVQLNVTHVGLQGRVLTRRWDLSTSVKIQKSQYLPALKLYKNKFIKCYLFYHLLSYGCPPASKLNGNPTIRLQQSQNRACCKLMLENYFKNLRLKSRCPVLVGVALRYQG